MDLPQELIREIIHHIPSNDQQSFQNCSLVAKSWVHPSRRFIFWTVDVSGAARLKSWLDKISPTNVQVLQHVRSLTCYIADSPGSPHQPVDLLRDYSPSFRQLERLAFQSGYLPSLGQIETLIYPAFQHTVSHLCLECCSFKASALVTLVNCFPNLAHLDLVSVFHSVDTQSTPPFSRPLQTLSVADLTDLVLIDQLMEPLPQCDEVNVNMYWASCSPLAQRVINGVGASVKHLNLQSNIAGAFSVPKWCSEDI